MTKKKIRNVLAPYMVADGVQPLDILMAATRFYLDKGDVQSAVNVATTAAQYRHPRLQAVAVQGQLFELDEAGGLTMSTGKVAKSVPALRINWGDAFGDNPADGDDALAVNVQTQPPASATQPSQDATTGVPPTPHQDGPQLIDEASGAQQLAKLDAMVRQTPPDRSKES